MARDGPRRRLLDDLAEVHDRHAVGDVAHHGQIVGDEQQRQIHVALQFQQQIDDLRPTDTSSAETASSQMMSLGCSAMARAMPIRCAARGELVGKALIEPLAARRAPAALCPSPPFGWCPQPVNHERLLEDPPDGVPGVERLHGILKDDLHLTPHGLPL